MRDWLKTTFFESNRLPSSKLTWKERLEYTFGGICRWFRDALNWRMVRGLGELQILTRTSYAMLVIVPILAGMWPAVRLVVNHHNRAVEDATSLLERSQVEFNETLTLAKQEIGQIEGPVEPEYVERMNKAIGSFETSSNNFLDDVNDYVEDYSERTLETPLLPWTLASAFFASLFVVLGHLLYQLAAPEQVQRMTWDEYVLSRKEDYSKHPSSETLIHARTVLESRLGQYVQESDEYENWRLLIRLNGISEYELKKELGELGATRLRSFQEFLDAEGVQHASQELVSEVKEKVQLLLEKVRNVPGDGEVAAGHEENMAVIERAARAEYLQYAEQRLFSTLITTLLYVCGIVLVVLIIKVQTVAVAQAAGWTSVFNLFSP